MLVYQRVVSETWVVKNKGCYAGMNNPHAAPGQRQVPLEGLWYPVVIRYTWLDTKVYMKPLRFSMVSPLSKAIQPQHWQLCLWSSLARWEIVALWALESEIGADQIQELQSSRCEETGGAGELDLMDKNDEPQSQSGWCWITYHHLPSSMYIHGAGWSFSEGFPMGFRFLEQFTKV